MKFLDVPRQRLGRFVHVVAEAANQLHRVAGGRERAAQRVRRWVRQTEQVLDLQFGFYATQVVNPVLEGVESLRRFSLMKFKVCVCVAKTMLENTRKAKSCLLKHLLRLSYGVNKLKVNKTLLKNDDIENESSPLSKVILHALNNEIFNLVVKKICCRSVKRKAYDNKKQLRISH